jgi:hypothetical protein
MLDLVYEVKKLQESKKNMGKGAIINNLIKYKGYGTSYIASIFDIKEDIVKGWISETKEPTDNDMFKILSICDIENTLSYNHLYDKEKITWNINNIIDKICKTFKIGYSDLSIIIGHSRTYLNNYKHHEKMLPRLMLIKELSKYSAIPIKEFYKDPVVNTNDKKIEKHVEIPPIKDEIKIENRTKDTEPNDKNPLSIKVWETEDLIEFCDERCLDYERYANACIYCVTRHLKTNIYDKDISNDYKEYVKDLKNEIILNEYHDM